MKAIGLSFVEKDRDDDPALDQPKRQARGWQPGDDRVTTQSVLRCLLQVTDSISSIGQRCCRRHIEFELDEPC